jgi:6-pyruvoyltetrahydropterin 2'-reductase
MPGMNVKQIIPADHYKTRAVFQKDGVNSLRVSEFFCDTIQGEGVYIGQPATFLRLSGCTLNCSYCDTSEVWNHGTPFSFKELFDLMDKFEVPKKLSLGQHLVFTGGSPLLQQKKIIWFLRAFQMRYQFDPFVEIENECIILPSIFLKPRVDTWNNSPKLSNSGIPLEKRYKEKIISYMSRQQDSWFKFVVSNENDWEEIHTLFLQPRLITRDQIILMPEGCTKEDIERNQEAVIDMCIKHNVRYSTREHIVVWGRKIGV